jgi:sulfotransferase family protein
MRRLPAELIPKLPRPAAAVVRNAVWGYGSATSFMRPLPDFLIIGAQKAGTTALYAYLRWHPALGGPSWKEVSYFDRRYGRGEAWYRGHFPNLLRTSLARRRHHVALVGEASPSYLFHPAAPERVAALVPDVKLIALVRNPTERALSHYNHEVSLGREPLPFEEALEREEERTRGEVERMLADPEYFSRAWWDHTYRARGLYVEQLERWLAVFPEEQLLVIASEDLLARPGETYARTLQFLGVAPHDLPAYPRVFNRDYPDMSPETRRMLNEYYAEPNRRLFALLGRELDWSADAR